MSGLHFSVEISGYVQGLAINMEYLVKKAVRVKYVADTSGQHGHLWGRSRANFLTGGRVVKSYYLRRVHRERVFGMS